MRSRYAIRPQLMPLEQRCVPARVAVLSGNLYIRDQVGGLSVNNLPGGRMRVSDLTGSVVVSGVGNTANNAVFILGTSRNDAIFFSSATTPYGGSLYFSGSNGNDTFRLEGKINGNVTLLGGAGNDTIRIGTTATSVGKPLTITGQLMITDPVGDNNFFIKGVTASVGGTLTATGQHQIILTNADLAVSQSFTLSSVSDEKGKPLDFALENARLYVGNHLNVIGYGGDDTFDASNGGLFVGMRLDAAGRPVYNATSRASFNFGSGDNQLILGHDIENGPSSVTKTDPAAMVLGDLSYAGSTGMDNVKLDYVVIGGQTSVTLGTGSNFYSDRAIRDEGDGYFAKLLPLSDTPGDITVVGGSEGNTLQFGWDFNLTNYKGEYLFLDTGYSINELSVALGNGTNSTTFTSGQSDDGQGGGAVRYPVDVSQSLTYTGGSGDDFVEMGVSLGNFHRVGGVSSFALGGGTNSLRYQVQAIQRNMTITGGSGRNTLDLATAAAIAATLNINLGTSQTLGVNTIGIQTAGDITAPLNFKLGNGTNTLDLTASGNIKANLAYIGGSGADTVRITANNQLDANVSLQLGDGLNQLDLIVRAYENTRPLRSVFIVGGKDRNNLGLSGYLWANFLIDLGNGQNVTTFHDSTAQGVGRITYRSGNNNNTLTLGGAQSLSPFAAFNVDVFFGTVGTQRLILTKGTITGIALSATPATSIFNKTGTIVNPFTINF